MGDIVGWTVFCSGTIHNPVFKHLLPFRTALPRCLTIQSIFVKVISHPALHNRTKDNKECDAKPGMIWPWRPCCGSCGRFSSHVCVECTCVPSGSLTAKGSFVTVLFFVGAFVTRK